MSQDHTAGVGAVSKHTSEDGGVDKEPLSEQGKEGTRDRGSDWPTLSHVSRPGPFCSGQGGHVIAHGTRGFPV